MSHHLLDDVRAAVAQALGLDTDEVTADATLLDDLGAESIDLLDLLFRLERLVGVKISAADLADHVQAPLSEPGMLDAQGLLTPAGAARLAQVLPQVDPSTVAGRLRSDAVLALFSVRNLADLVEARAAGAASTAAPAAA
jgi:acyl carrier protein